MAAALEGAGRLQEALAWHDYWSLLLGESEREIRRREIAADERAGLSSITDERDEAVWRAMRRYDAGGRDGGR